MILSMDLYRGRATCWRGSGTHLTRTLAVLPQVIRLSGVQKPGFLKKPGFSPGFLVHRFTGETFDGNACCSGDERGGR